MKPKTKEFLDTIKKTNRDLKDLIDIDKVNNNIESILLNLNTLNYIISQNEENFNKKIDFLFSKNKDCFNVIPLLIGIREQNIYINNSNKEITIFDMLNNAEDIKNIFKETGLLKLILNGKIKNFIDYAVGIEIGMDTNARKNRNGVKTEKFLQNKLMNIFKDRDDIVIYEQVKLNIGNDIADNKIFDIVIKNKNTNKNILIESSFYNSYGSKINETAKSYKQLNTILKNYNNYEFIWVADGIGMQTIKNILDSIIDDDFIMNHFQFFSKIKNKI